jgi:dTDP-4-amino-4,6-dideoxygalactose transaminase
MTVDGWLVPLVDLAAPYAALKPLVREAINRVLDGQQLVLGDEVRAFEADMGRRIGHERTAVAVASGSDALLLALMASDIGRGDEVITTPFTFFATAGAIARSGATVMFCDIEPNGFNLDSDRVLERVGPRTKALLPVHLFGRCTRMAPLLEEANRSGLMVIEDCAQAIDATSDGVPAGALGDFGCFSFHPSKNLGAYGDGGLVVARDRARAERLTRLRQHGGTKHHHHEEVGMNSRLDEIQAAVLNVKLRFLTEWTRLRRARAEDYRAMFAAASLDGVALPDDDAGHVYHQFTIRCPRRDALAEHLTARGIATRVYYPVPLHLQPCFASLGHRRGDFPNAERAASEVLSLPMYPELRRDQQERVVDAITDFFRGRR